MKTAILNIKTLHPAIQLSANINGPAFVTRPQLTPICNRC
jgi:hypothetical protein